MIKKQFSYLTKMDHLHHIEITLVTLLSHDKIEISQQDMYFQDNAKC